MQKRWLVSPVLGLKASQRKLSAVLGEMYVPEEN
jgi:hypothetical protein